MLGQRIRSNHGTTAIFAPDGAFAGGEISPAPLAARGLDWEVGAAVLSRLLTLVQCIDFNVYGEFEAKTRKRIRDSRDWPVLVDIRLPPLDGGSRFPQQRRSHMDHPHRDDVFGRCGVISPFSVNLGPGRCHRVVLNKSGLVLI